MLEFNLHNLFGFLKFIFQIHLSLILFHFLLNFSFLKALISNFLPLALNFHCSIQTRIRFLLHFKKIQFEMIAFQHLLSKIHLITQAYLSHSLKLFIHLKKVPPQQYQMFRFLVLRKISPLIHSMAKFIRFVKYQEKCNQVRLLLPQSFTLLSPLFLLK